MRVTVQLYVLGEGKAGTSQTPIEYDCFSPPHVGDTIRFNVMTIQGQDAPESPFRDRHARTYKVMAVHHEILHYGTITTDQLVMCAVDELHEEE